MCFLSPQVNQRNVPGIDNAYLAMDTEEGVEVVWNEVMFSERKNFKLQEVELIFIFYLYGKISKWLNIQKVK